MMRYREGFTLIELLVVVAIIGILAAVAIPKLLSAIEKSKTGAVCGDIGSINSAMELYQVDVKAKKLPRTTLLQLISDSINGWSGPYIMTINIDPWNNSYTYTGSGENYTIMSVHDSDYNKSETIKYVFGDGMITMLP